MIPFRFSITPELYRQGRKPRPHFFAAKNIDPATSVFKEDTRVLERPMPLHNPPIMVVTPFLPNRGKLTPGILQYFGAHYFVVSDNDP
jgi:hypothetical protein